MTPEDEARIDEAVRQSASPEAIRARQALALEQTKETIVDDIENYYASKMVANLVPELKEFFEQAEDYLEYRTREVLKDPKFVARVQAQLPRLKEELGL